MERVLILLVAAGLTVLVAPGVQGTFHLSFANNTQVEISRNGCGVNKTCLETPTNCDPAVTGSCLFVSVDTTTPMAPNGTTFSVELAGQSEGYIALGLKASASQGITKLFICAQNSSNNGTFFFRTMEKNNTNGMLSPVETIVREIRGEVIGNTIRCEFDIPNVNASNTRASADTTFTVSIGTGNVTDDGSIGAFNVDLTRGPLDLSDPTSTATTQAPSTMTTTMTTTQAISTTMSSGSKVHPLAHVLLLSILSFAFLLRA